MHKTLRPIYAGALCLLTLLLGVNTLEAQANKTFDLLDALAKFKSQVESGIEVSFTISTQGLQTGQADQYDGVIWIKGQRFMLNTPELDVAYDGKTLRTINRTEKTFYLSEPTKQELGSLNPLAYINQTDKHYRITKGKQKPGFVTYRFTPTSGSLSHVQQYEVTFSQQTSRPQQVDLIYGSNQKLSITVKSIRAKQRVSSQSFTFAPQEYKFLETIDLR